MTSPLTIAAINAFDQQAFVDALGGVFEHSPLIAQAAYAARPFRSVDELHAAMMAAVFVAPREKQVELLCAHPELAGQEAQEGTLTRDSTSEQSRLGFNALTRDELAHMTALNRRYREKFGFPCIIALRRHETRATVTAEHERRLGNERDEEIDACLEQVGFITRGRLDKLIA